jgi:serine/threonine-protein kinase
MGELSPKEARRAPEATRVEVPMRGRPSRVDGDPPPAEAGGEPQTASVAAGPDWVRASVSPHGREPDLSFLAGWERYRIVAFLGAGGMGQVYKAYDPGLKRFVALKFLRWNDPVQLERFLREARAQARVEHPHDCKDY